MTLSDSLSTALHQHGQKLLAEASLQANNLGNSKDSEALHDFRVSVRRLRSFLKSFEDYLKNAKKHRQKLSGIMDLTNAERDTEVHILWLKARAEKANVLEKSGLSYLLEHLNNDEHVNLKKVKKHFAEITKKLEKVFSSTIKVNEDITFGAAIAQVLQNYREELETLLQKVQNAEDEVVHEARIVGKRLRYTLELLDTKASNALVKRLKKLQDSAGDLHDLQVLEPKVQNLLYAETTLWAQTFRDSAKTLPNNELKELPELQRSYALAEIARIIDEEKNALYHELETSWLAGANAGFFADVDNFMTQLQHHETTFTAESSKPTVKRSRTSKASQTP